jgi:hypothetical protein
MKNIRYISLAILALSACKVQKPEVAFQDTNVERIIRTLSADDMQGRQVFTPGIEKAAKFIEEEFKSIGLQPMEGNNGFRQELSMYSIRPQSATVTIGGKSVEADRVMLMSEEPALSWTSGTADIDVVQIKEGEAFMTRYRTIMRSPKKTLVLVDDSFRDAFGRIRHSLEEGRTVNELGTASGSKVFVLGATEAADFKVDATNKVEKVSTYNIAGVIPGKSKAKELVIFSGHYDHIGIREAVNGDSIANGADDDASGITAVISLARYYKRLANNERTLVFVAFTAEEIGMVGSTHFSRKLNPDDVTAMFNIEMIGKESKFGKNSAFITGFERSDFAKILQKNLEGTEFTFHPDPYPSLQLFYRSDNATLAALGVPAHTISTDQIDTDKFYHSVDDEFSTMDIANISATIRAIALSARGIVAGTDTPSRVPKLKQP